MISSNTTEKLDGIIVDALELPLKEAKEGTYSVFLNMQLIAAKIMSSPEFNDTDERLGLLVNWMISTVPNLKFQQDIRKKRDDRIKSETKGTVDSKELGRIKQSIHADIFGEITNYMDIYSGVDRTNRVSFIVPIKEMRDLLQKYNPQHFEEHFTDSVLKNEKGTSIRDV